MTPTVPIAQQSCHETRVAIVEASAFHIPSRECRQRPPVVDDAGQDEQEVAEAIQVDDQRTAERPRPAGATA